MRREEPREPTADECEQHAKVFEDEDRVGHAIWYPQMGGYVGKAVVVFDKEKPGCFEAYVWHDGDFPFKGRDHYGNENFPECIHHCSAEQFIDFGRTVLALQGQQEGE